MNPATDPSSIDFTDAFNPLTLNQYSEALRPDDYSLLESPLYMALRRAATLEPFLQVVPEGVNIPVAARQTYQGRFYLPHGSFLYGVSTNSQQAEGFAWNLHDLGNGGALFRSPVSSKVTGGGTTQGVSTRLMLLQHPRAILTPGLLSAQITNASPSSNLIQLVLWFMVPEQGELRHAPNVYDQQLQAELTAQSRVQRAMYTGGGTVSVAGNPVTPGAEPWSTMPQGGQPLRFSNVAAVPAPGTTDFAVLTFTVPTGYTAALKHYQHVYLGPGFDSGSGDLIWRLLVDGLAAPGFDSMTTATAGYEDIDGAILARSGQTVTYTVSVAAGAVLPEDTLAAVTGFFYPQ